MKKKFSILFVLVLVLPLFALFGCGEAKYFNFYASTNNSNGFFTSLPNKVKEGSQVKITAVAKENNYFVAWLFKDKILQTDDVYKIEDVTKNDAEKVTKSELTFKSSQVVEGSYTAIFSESASTMQYAKFDAIMLSSQENASPDTDYTKFNSVLLSPSVSVSQGSSNVTTVYSNEALQFRELLTSEQAETPLALKIAADNISSVMYLDPDISQQIHVNFRLSYEYDLYADILMHENDAKWKDGTNCTYKVQFENDGTYKIVLKFNLNSDEETTLTSPTLYLTLFFTTLR